jgi:hypothetical protein
MSLPEIEIVKYSPREGVRMTLLQVQVEVTGYHAREDGIQALTGFDSADSFIALSWSSRTGLPGGQQFARDLRSKHDASG